MGRFLQRSSFSNPVHRTGVPLLTTECGAYVTNGIDSVVRLEFTRITCGVQSRSCKSTAPRFKSLTDLTRQTGCRA